MSEHLYAGQCPDAHNPDGFDPNCPRCREEARRLRIEAENKRLVEAVSAALESIKDEQFHDAKAILETALKCPRF